MVSMIHWPPYLEDLGPENPLDRVKTILNYLGDPQNKLRNVFHITGTNGKGSTASYIFSVLKTAGYKVNLYTSPHLYRYNERIIINGSEISDSRLLGLLEKVRLACEDIDIMPSIFEVTTICAFLAFSESDSDANVIEVGMGGRLDATNVFDYCGSLLSVFTSIHVDHIAFLGTTPEQNALEKSYIIKPHRTVISSLQIPNVEKLLNAVADDRQSPFYSYGNDFAIDLIDEMPNKMLFSLHGIRMTLNKPSLPGAHQLLNASTAIASLLISGIQLTIDDIDIGIKNTSWPARLERVWNTELLNCLPALSEIYLDGAHNISGAKVLADFLQSHDDSKKSYIIIGRSRDTDSESFLYQFKGIIKCAVAVTVKQEPFAEAAEKIVVAGKKAGIDIVKAENIKDALLHIAHHSSVISFNHNAISLPNHDANGDNNTEAISGQASKNGIRVIICGSLYLSRDIKYYD